jgi:hypothetical protein
MPITEVGPYRVLLQDTGKVLLFKNGVIILGATRKWDDYSIAQRYYDKLIEKLEKETGEVAKEV